MTQHSYPAAIAPAAAGLVLGLVDTLLFPGSSASSQLYVTLPEYALWCIIMIAQSTIYVTIGTYLWVTREDTRHARLSARNAALTALFTAFVVVLPTFWVRRQHYALPFNQQEWRQLAVVALALLVMLLVTNRIARVFAELQRAQDLETYATLRGESRDLLMISGLCITLGTVGAGILQRSLSAMERATKTHWGALSDTHVLAYGAYFTLVMVLFFTPLLVAERQAAVRIARGGPAPASPEVESRLGLNASLAEYLVSTFGILSPLLGAVATRLLS